MAISTPFSGFPKDIIHFLNDLKSNNNKMWFEENRQRYEDAILEPSKAFVSAMGSALEKIAPKIQADPRVNKSLFRINRDTRFSKDKTPYKTSFAAMFWEGQGKRMESSCFYFHLETDSLMFGVGIHTFTKEQLEAYRTHVDAKKSGEALDKVLQPFLADNAYNVTDNRYKKVPRGYEENHPRAELLKFKGITAGKTIPIPKELHSERLVQRCVEEFTHLTPIHRWLVELTRSVN